MARTTKLLLTGPPCASAAGAERGLDLNIPQWFSSALAAPVQECTTTVAGCTISYRCWGPAGAAGIILVHGGAAHARWWDHIAPMLGPQYRVAALDLSGHGDSGRRETYTLEQWSAEVVAVGNSAGMAANPVVIGHSMGGFVALATAKRHPQQISGVAVLDSPVRERTPEEIAAARHAAFGPLRIYPDRAQALSRFRTIPRRTTTCPTSWNTSRRHPCGRPAAAGRGSSTRGSSAASARPRNCSPRSPPGSPCSAASTAC